MMLKIRHILLLCAVAVQLLSCSRPSQPLPFGYYRIDIPDRHLVRGLRVLNSRNERGESTTSGNMIESLYRKGIWFRNTATNNPDRKSTQRQTEAVYYQRDFINKWLANGWIVKEELRNRYILTPEGRNIIDTFYTDSVQEDCRME